MVELAIRTKPAFGDPHGYGFGSPYLDAQALRGTSARDIDCMNGYSAGHLFSCLIHLLPDGRAGHSNQAGLRRSAWLRVRFAISRRASPARHVRSRHRLHEWIFRRPFVLLPDPPTTGWSSWPFEPSRPSAIRMATGSVRHISTRKPCA